MSDLNLDHLAKLAHLRLSDEEREQVQSDLQRIIDMVDQMQSVDTEGIAPLSHPLDAKQRLRPDAVTEIVDREHFQQGAPATRDGLYLVPRVVE